MKEKSFHHSKSPCWVVDRAEYYNQRSRERVIVGTAKVTLTQNILLGHTQVKQERSSGAKAFPVQVSVTQAFPKVKTLFSTTLNHHGQGNIRTFTSLKSPSIHTQHIMDLA